MKIIGLLLLTLIGSTAAAQSNISDHCPNAPTALAVTFPLDLSSKVTSGEAIVDFVIGADGSISNAHATSSSGRAFALAAVAAVQGLSCNQRALPEHFSLPVAFYKPGYVPLKRCPGYIDIAFNPRRFWEEGIYSGSVTFEFTLQAAGQVTDGAVLRASSPALATMTLSLLQRLQCSPSGDPAQRVRGAFAF